MGDIIIGQTQSLLIRSVNIRQDPFAFTTITLELICPQSFGVSLDTLQGINFIDIFKSKQVVESINSAMVEEIGRTRKIKFKDE